MTPEMWIALSILVIAILFFVTEWLRVDIVAIGVVIALMLSGILTVNEAVSGFASTAVMTIAALFVVGGAVLQTGLAQMMGDRILKVAGKSEFRLTAVIMIAVAVMSSFMSDTGVVAVMLPAIISLAAVVKVPPSKLLIPVAVGSLLGGASTLIGTPPNIIVSDILLEHGLEPFSFFSFTPMGIILVTAGVLFMVFVGRYLLPSNTPHHDVQAVETPEELLALYRLPDNLFRLRVRRQSPLVGKTIVEARLGTRYPVTVIEIARLRQPQTVARLGEQRLVIQSDAYEHFHEVNNEILQPDDILLVQAAPSIITTAAAAWNLAVQPASPADQAALISDEVGIAEVVLPPRSSLIGKTLPDLRFGTVYRLTILEIRRPSVDQQLDLKNTPLAFGDTLLVQGEWKNIAILKRRRRDFIVIGEPDQAGGIAQRAKAPAALAILLGMLVLIVTGWLPVATASMLAALLMVLSGCLSMDEAYEAVNWKSIVLVAGMLPMATALEKVGLVNLAATGFVSTIGEFGPRFILAGLFLLTTVFTQVLSNTATAVLLAPVALVTAQRLDISPYAFLMAIAIAASTAFASPVASPVNTLVMGAGNYRFSDFAKVGIPLILVVMVISVLVTPLLWPF